MKAGGRHAMMDFRTPCADVLADELRDIVTNAAKLAGATVLEARAIAFEPHGVSAFAVLSESHVSVHTWPEHNAVFVDAFTCGDVDPRDVCESIFEALDGRDPSRCFITRRV